MRLAAMAWPAQRGAVPRDAAGPGPASRGTVHQRTGWRRMDAGVCDSPPLCRCLMAGPWLDTRDVSPRPVLGYGERGRTVPAAVRGHVEDAGENVAKATCYGPGWWCGSARCSWLQPRA